MKNFALTVGCALLATALPVAAHAADKSPQAQLARALEGRVAGNPVDCIQLRNIRSSQIIDKTAIVYDGPGDTLYVNYPDAGAQSLDNWVYQVTDTHSSQLCSIDTVKLYDRGSNSFSGVVFLGQFIPYRKAAEGS